MGKFITTIAFIGIFVGIIWIIVIRTKYKGLNEYDLTKKTTIPVTIEVICFILLGIIIIAGGSHSSSTKDDDVDVKKEIEKKICTNKTDDYHKCSWSIIEDRCVCKQR